MSASTTMARPPPPIPRDARTYYKVVAFVNNRFVSIFDGRTTYVLDEVTSPRGGCWVAPDLLAVVQHAAHLPRKSKYLEAPRVILRVAGWNDAGIPPEMPSGHGEAGRTKLLVANVMPLAVIPYTAAGQVGAANEHQHLSQGVATLSASMRSGRPTSAPAPRPPALTTPAGENNRNFGAGQAQAQRLQAATALLHEDVMLAEAHLARLQGIQRVTTPSDAPQSDWVRRALARNAPAPQQPRAVRAAS